LIAAGAEVDVISSGRDSAGATPLFLAASGQKAETAKLLLDKGANPNVTGTWSSSPGMTPLMIATSQGDVELMKRLLRAKANPNAVNGRGFYALHNAFNSDNRNKPEVVRTLLAAGADPDKVASEDRLPLLIYALRSEASKEVIAVLIEAKANVNAPDSNDKTPLHWAASGNRKDLVELLIKAGADVNLRDKQGKTPLDYVKGNNQTVGGAVRMLPRAAMPAPVPDFASSTPVAEAKSTPDEVALLLRQHGAMDELPDFTRIRITRQGLAQSLTVFTKGQRLTNHFTLLETLMRFYGQQSVFLETRKTFGPPYEMLPFPDFGRIIIRRPALKPDGKEQEIKVSLLNGKGVVDCAKDVAVEFGDVIEVPERVHALNEALDDPVREMEKMFKKAKAGLIPGQSSSTTFVEQVDAMRSGEVAVQYAELLTCLQKSVQIVVAGSTTTLTVDSWKEGFLNQALTKVEARAALRSSSDLPRVQVKRKATKTGKLITLTVDATDGNDALWVQDGDVIEVPDKP
jgi:hypothetical protein